MAGKYDYLGKGLDVPFRRSGKSGFAIAEGIDSVEASLMVIFGTLCAGPNNNGELPFNQNLGCLIKLLRHENVDDPETEELATHYLLDAVQKNERRVRAKAIGFVKDTEGNLIRIRFVHDVVDRDTLGVKVIKSDVQREFSI